MATANPYDRREIEKRRRDRGQGLVDVSEGYHFEPLADGRRAYPGFTVARLEELMRDEFARGFNAGEGSMEREHEEKILPRVQRQVWDQGHAAGHADGRNELVEEIGGLFETLTVELHTDLAAALADEKTEPEILRSLASRSARLLKEMIDAHHHGFEPESPF